MPAQLQRLIRRPTPERGFTLIELLVVIIILGILAAVVVFAVSGVGDKGKSSAVTIDARTLRTAEEAYCAKNGQYGSGQELVAGGFLSDSPEYHSVSAQKTGFGQCNGWTYSIVETEEASGVASGTWAAAPSPPIEAGGGSNDSITRLPNGKIVALGNDTDFSYVTSVWDPGTGAWTTMDPQPGPGSFTTLYNSEPLLTQNCGQNCGKILYKFQGSSTPWFLFNSEAASGSQWEQVPGNNFGGSGSQVLTLMELRDNPATPASECAVNCGKVLLIGSLNGGVAPVDLYDPNNGPTGAFTSITNSDSVLGEVANATLLPDGRVLLVGTCTIASSGCASPTSFARFFDPLTLAFSVAPAPTTQMRRIENQAGPASPVLPNGDILVGGIAFRNSLNRTRPAAREIYTPQYRQPGYWTDPVSGLPRLVPVCGPPSTSTYCQILGTLPDGRVLAYPSGGGSRLQSATSPGQSYLLDPNTRTWSRSGDFDAGAVGDGELLDPRTGPCGAYCNKMFMVGQPFQGGAYSSAFFTP